MSITSPCRMGLMKSTSKWTEGKPTPPPITFEYDGPMRALNRASNAQWQKSTRRG